MTKPNVSIIVATYNSSKTIKDALDSILYQYYQDWECIIVDGASNDNTVSIIKEFKNKDHRFRYISEPDNGIYDAFNKGWKMAQGEWIHYLGSDDKLTKNGIDDLIHSSIGYDLVSGATYITLPTGRVIYQKSIGVDGCHQSKIIKRSTIEKLGGFDESLKIISDYDLMLKIEKGNYKIKNIDSFISFFYAGGISQSFKAQIRLFKEREHVYKKNRISHPRLRNLYGTLHAYIIILIHKIY